MPIGWRNFLAGAATATIVVGIAATWLVKRVHDVANFPYLPRAQYFDMSESGYLTFSGTIGNGKNDEPMLNIFQARCFRERNECETAEVTKIGDNQWSDIDQTTYSITSWNKNYLTAESRFPQCVTITLRVNRTDKTVEYIRSPKPKSERNPELCRAINLKTIVWPIGEPPRQS